jgi:hypothetical protein
LTAIAGLVEQYDGGRRGPVWVPQPVSDEDRLWTGASLTGAQSYIAK